MKKINKKWTQPYILHIYSMEVISKNNDSKGIDKICGRFDVDS